MPWRSRSVPCSPWQARRTPSRSRPATRTSSLRWDNTVRYNLGVRAQAQDPPILGNPNFDDGDRNFTKGSHRHEPPGPAVRIRLRRGPAQVRLPRERGRLVRQRVQQPRQHQQRDRQHAGQRPAGRRRAEPVHQALLEGPVGRAARRVRLRELRRGRHARQHQGGPAHRVLGRQPAPRRRGALASRTRRTRSTCRRASRRPAARRRSSSVRAARSRCRRSRRAICRSRGSGSTTGRRCASPSRAATSRSRTASTSAATRSSSAPNPFLPRRFPARPRCCAHGTSRHTPPRDNSAASATSACRRAGARSGSTARWASTAATPPTSCRRSLLDAGPRAGRARRGVHGAIGGSRAARQHAASSTRTRPRSPTCRSTASSARTRPRLRRRHPHLRRDAGQGNRRRERRRGTVATGRTCRCRATR